MDPRNDSEKREGTASSGTQCLFVFSSVHQVMKAEKILKAGGYRVDLIPMPREISSDCGVAVELSVELHEEALVLLRERGLPLLVSYVRRDGRYERLEKETPRPSDG